MLTILSTVLGLIPFLFDGRQSQFWFSFAVGVMSGMLFSVIAIVMVMPVFLPMVKGVGAAPPSARASVRP
jgi:multidrug efflux pump subunit AcrB